MAEDTVDRILTEPKYKFEPLNTRSQTTQFKLIGSYSRGEITHGYVEGNDHLFEEYEDHFVFNYDIPRECAKNLVHSYGTASLRVV